MAWGCFVALLLLVAPPTLGQHLHPKPGLEYSYDCGVQGMQLLVIPRSNQTIRFKVLDEFGNRFEVNNCSICYHWVISEPHEPAVFSADYKGCHVLQKGGRFHLRVFMQAVLPNGHVDIAQDVTLICPKADLTGTLDPNLAAPTTPQPFTPQTSAPHTNAGHTLAGSSHTLLSTMYPEHSFNGSSHTLLSTMYPEHSVIHSTPAPSLGPGPAGPTVPRPQWGTLSPLELTKLDSVGTHLTEEQCQVASGHIPCIVKSSSKEACQQAGCCYDNTREVPCYYGNTATLQCSRSGYFTLVISQETALTHRVMLNNIHLAYAPNGCPPTQRTSAFVVFHVPLTLCGTTIQVVGEQLIYENQLVSNIDVQKGPQGSITRDSVFQTRWHLAEDAVHCIPGWCPDNVAFPNLLLLDFRLHVRCVFNASDFLPVQASIFSPLPPAPVTQSGPLQLELRIAKDKTFSSYYQERDYPLVRLLREPVHVEIRLLQRTDPSMVLMLHQCWATPTASPFQQPQWPILSDGCPFKGDNYRTQMVAVDRAELLFPSHYRRFTITTFTLLDSSSQSALRGLVYFFCSASVCYPEGSETCSTICDSGMARHRRSSGHHNSTVQALDIVSSPGAVGFEDVAKLESSGSSRNSNSRPLLWVLLLLLSTTLVLGAGVFVGLSWAWAQKFREGTRC